MDKLGCPFELRQLSRAIGDGTLSWVHDDVRSAIQSAYLAMKRANSFILAIPAQSSGLDKNNAITGGQTALKMAQVPLADALTAVRSALGSPARSAND